PARVRRTCRLRLPCRGEQTSPHGHGRRIALPAEPVWTRASETSPNAVAKGAVAQPPEVTSPMQMVDKTLWVAPAVCLIDKAPMSLPTIPTAQTSLWVWPGARKVTSLATRMAVEVRRHWP